MEKELLLKSPLFAGFTAEELNSLLAEGNCFEKTFLKDELILHAGETVESLGIVTEGRVQIEKNDFWGNKSVLDCLGKNQVFAETYALSRNEPLMVDVTALENTRVLFINLVKSAFSPLITKLKLNLLTVSSRKNLILSRRISCTSPKSVRGRLLSFLSFQSTEKKSVSFDISFNRQQLADYLNVDRSAMCAELSRMQKDGLIEYEHNHFVLKNVI